MGDALRDVSSVYRTEKEEGGWYILNEGVHELALR